MTIEFAIPGFAPSPQNVDGIGAPSCPSFSLGGYQMLSPLSDLRSSPVYLCRKPNGTKLYVAKLCYPEFADDCFALARFCNEVQLLSEVRSPYVVRPLEYFVDGDVLGFVMEYVGGGTLGCKLSRQGKIAPKRALALLQDIAHGLKALHDHGITHRDVKPDNVLLTTRGRAKLSDLGVAIPNHYGLEGSDVIAGSLEFMSPEYLVSGQSDARSDIYSLGLIAYELLTGTKPFDNNCIKMLLRERLSECAASTGRQCSQIPRALASVVDRMIERDPANRPQSIDFVLSELDAVATEFTSHEAARGGSQLLKSELSKVELGEALERGASNNLSTAAALLSL